MSNRWRGGKGDFSPLYFGQLSHHSLTSDQFLTIRRAYLAVSARYRIPVRKVVHRLVKMSRRQVRIQRRHGRVAMPEELPHCEQVVIVFPLLIVAAAIETALILWLQ